MTGRGSLEQAAHLAQLLSSLTRLRILTLVAREELCVCELAEVLGVSQPAASQHLARLRDAGLVSERRVGQMALYTAADIAGRLEEGLLRVLTRPAEELPETAGCLSRLEPARMRRAERLKAAGSSDRQLQEG